MLFLTADTGPLSPIVYLFGLLMNLIYNMLVKIGIGNIGLSIIIFTLITKILMYPLSVKQQKSSKLMSIIQPEIQAIQKKYEGQKDQATLMKQQQEIKAVYEKYGTSMSGSCVQLLIQMPIILALYRVIMNIPAYVNSIKIHYENIVEAIGGINVIEKLKDFANDNKLTNILNQVHNFDVENIEAKKNLIIDFLYKLNPNQLKSLIETFPTTVQQTVAENINFINDANSFLGLNLATAPNVNGFIPNPYWLIPLFAFLSNYLSVVLMQKANKNPMLNEEDQTQQTMKTLNVMMPIMSAVFCFTFATGIGIYWIASSLFMVLQQFIINAQLKNLDIDLLIKENIEKSNKKREKKGLPLINSEKATNVIKRMEEKALEEEQKRKEVIEKQKSLEEKANEFYFKDEDSNSIFAKARMVQKYNEKHNK